MNTIKFSSYGHSDIGTTRLNNEDVWIALPDYHFFALADGMGGHLAGEIAAQETLDHLCQSVKTLSQETNTLSSQISFLKLAIQKANKWVHELGQSNSDYTGMGTTLCSLLFHNQQAIYAHVGDSRIYRFRKSRLVQLTEDHSLLRKWSSSLEECPPSYKHVITKAIGTTPDVVPEIDSISIESNDTFFLCSDGLSDFVPHDAIEKTLFDIPSIEEASISLIEQAKTNGSKDNITVLMIQLS